MTWVQDLIEFSASRLTNRERDALLSRGVSDDQIDLFKLGHLNKELPEGVPKHFLDWSQNGKKLDDVFVFPLTTTLGEVRGFQFRHVVRERIGYMDYFLDRREPCLFGLSQAIESMWVSQSVYLVEGAFDLFPVQRALSFVVATITAYTTPQTVALLRRLVQRVWLGYDMDSTGRSGCKTFKARYEKDFEVTIISYPRVNGKQMKDPGELWEAWGDAQVVPFIRSAMAQSDSFLIKKV